MAMIISQMQKHTLLPTSLKSKKHLHPPLRHGKQEGGGEKAGKWMLQMEGERGGLLA
jgi:hypothetical protein